MKFKDQTITRSDLITYVNDVPASDMKTTTTKGGGWGKSKTTTTGYYDSGEWSKLGGGDSYILINSDLIKDMTIDLSQFHDLYDSKVGFYKVDSSTTFASDAEQKAYIEQYMQDHPESMLGNKGTSITLTDLHEGDKVMFYMLSKSSMNDKNPTLVMDYNLRDAHGTFANDDNLSKMNQRAPLMDPGYAGTAVAMFFGNYSTTGWRANDVMLMTTFVTTVEISGHEYEVTFGEGENGTGTAVKIVDTETGTEVDPMDIPIEGQPLPGVLSVLILAGCGGAAFKFRKQKKA